MQSTLIFQAEQSTNTYVSMYIGTHAICSDAYDNEVCTLFCRSVFTPSFLKVQINESAPALKVCQP